SATPRRRSWPTTCGTGWRTKPIRARRPSLVQRVRKWARRHKALVWATMVVVFLAAGLGGCNWFLWIQKRRAAEAEARAARQEAIELLKMERWPEALSAARRAKGVLVGVGANPELWDDIERLEKDADMVLRLQEASLQAAKAKDLTFDWG